MIAQRFYGGLDSFVLVAIPLFMFTGEIMNKSGFTRKLVNFTSVIAGRRPGALAYANVISSFFFAGITGAAVSDVAALGTIFIPEMKREGYTPAFSAAITAVSSIMGPIIPPSTIILVYGALTNTSIAGLFAAALVPGVLAGLSNIILIYYQSKKGNFPRPEPHFSRREKLFFFKESILPLFMPIIILGGLFSGVFTPTEAAAVASGYALVIVIFVYHSMSLADIYKCMINAVIGSSKILVIIGCASILGWILAKYQIPQWLTSMLIEKVENPIVTMVLIVLFLIFIGTWMESLAAVVLIAPMLVQVAINFGYHPLHFGIVFVFAMVIGLITPPIGLCLFMVTDISGAKFNSIVKETIPYTVFYIVILFILVFFPSLVLWIPKMLNLA